MSKSKISPLVFVPPAIFALLAGLFLSGMFRDDPDGLPSTRVGGTVPALVLTELGTGPGIDDATLRGEGVKLVNFWASWCAPCRAEHPNLERLAEAGIPIYAINYKDKPANAMDFLAELGDPYTGIAADDTGRTALEWGVYGVPETFVIDGNGVVHFRFAGPITSTVIENQIMPAIEAARAAGS